MHCAVMLPVHRLGGEFASPPAVAEMARAAEAAGFSAVSVTDHPLPPDTWLQEGGHHALDPFVALSFAAAATSRLRLATHVLVLPYRNPWIVSKAASTLDVLSGGRLILGVAPGYLGPEMTALGVAPEEREERFDEGLAAMKAAWSGRSFSFAGRFFRAAGHTQLPAPAQHPHPPLWIGGNGARALRRAVEKANGWCPYFNPRGPGRIPFSAPLESIDELRRRLSRARERWKELGRQGRLEVAIGPPPGVRVTSPAIGEAAQRLWNAGATWLHIAFGGRTRAQWIDHVRNFGEQFLPGIRALGETARP